MPYLRLLVGIGLAAALAAWAVSSLASSIGAAAALGVGALIVVATSALFHSRFGRGLPGLDVSPPPLVDDPPLPSGYTEDSASRTPPIWAMAAVVAVVLLGMLLVSLSGLFESPASSGPYGGGGIGSVSSGISEALVESAMGLVIVVFLFLVIGRIGGGGRGGDSK